MKNHEYHIGSGTVLINGKARGAVASIEFTPASAEVPAMDPTKIIRPGPIIVSGKVDMSTLVGLDLAFGPPSSGPPEFSITPGDARPGQTIRARDLTPTSTGAGVDVSFTSTVHGLDIVSDPETCRPRFVVTTEGGYEIPVTRETFIALAIEWEMRRPNEVCDLDALRRELEEWLPHV